MKRTSYLLLAGIFSFTALFSSCGNKTKKEDIPVDSQAAKQEEEIDPMGKYSEPVEVTAVLAVRPPEDPKTPKDVTPQTNTFIKLLKENFNINLRFLWTVPTDQFEQKFGVSMASGDLPDLLTLDATKGHFENLYEQNQLADLTEIYKNYASEDVKKYIEADGGKALDSIKKDGKVYGLPHYADPKQTAQVLWIRDDWMKKLHLQPPRTIDELEKMAEAFTTKDPDGNGKNDTYGLGIQKKPIFWGFDLRGFFHGYGAYPMNWIKDSGGNLIAGEVQPQVRDALLRLQSMYKKGLIDKEFAMKDDTKFVEDLVAGKVGLVYGEWWYPAWPLNLVKDKNPEAEWKCYPVPSADGKDSKTIISRVWISNVLAVSKKCKNPEAAMKVLNLYVDMDEKKYGPEAKAEGGYVYTWVPFKLYYPMQIEHFYNFTNQALKEQRDPETIVDPFKAGVETVYKKSKLWLETGEGTENWGAYYSRVSPEGGWGTVKKIVEGGNVEYNEFYGPVLPTQQEKGASFEKMMEETYDKIIMGEDIKKFDEYVDKWHKLGGNDLTKEANEWFKKKK